MAKRDHNAGAVLYIAGYGRSGSTLLDIALGNQPGMMSAGELSNFPRLLQAAREYCSCGARVDECAFWSEVARAWADEAGADAVSEAAQLFPRLESPERRALTLMAFRRRSASAQRYLELNRALFAAIRRVSGAETVIDSSKNPVRAQLLGHDGAVNGLNILHLVRDARGVAWSVARPWKKDLRAGIQQDMPGKPVWRTALRWRQFNANAEKAIAALPRVPAIRLRYEDLVTDPGAAMDAMENSFGLRLDAVRNALSGGVLDAGRHLVAGNRLRMEKRIELRPDTAWMDALSPRQLWLVRMIAGAMMRNYGYDPDRIERPDTPSLANTTGQNAGAGA